MLRRFWKFVWNGKNRESLSWLGGGAVVIVTGAWALFTYFFPHDDKKPAATTPIVVGHAPVSDAGKPLTDQLERLAAQVARDKGLEITPLRTILVKLGEVGVRDEDIPKRLDEKTDELIKLREEIAKLRQGPPELASYPQQAQALIDKGEFDGARAALVAGLAAVRGMRQQSSRFEAQFLAQEAQIDHLQLAYRSASTKYAEAARLMENVDQQQQWEFLLAQANELYSQGDEFGDNVALSEAIVVNRKGLLLAPSSQRPLAWAATQNNLGTALQTLGAREGGTARLEEAVAAFREALKERTRERAPLDWATTQNNLGKALQALGERESGTARLEEAVAAYRDALQERTRERAPLDWATTQNNLATALEALGERESGAARFEEAVFAYRDALQELTRERVPLAWAATQNNLGKALQALGERESGTAVSRGRFRLSRRPQGKDSRARAARLGRDPEQSWQCALGARRA
jgi:tetratricopeptide (TPR) repeat protein